MPSSFFKTLLLNCILLSSVAFIFHVAISIYFRVYSRSSLYIESSPLRTTPPSVLVSQLYTHEAAITATCVAIGTSDQRYWQTYPESRFTLGVHEQLSLSRNAQQPMSTIPKSTPSAGKSGNSRHSTDSVNRPGERFDFHITNIRRCERRLRLAGLDRVEGPGIIQIAEDCREALKTIVKWADGNLQPHDQEISDRSTETLNRHPILRQANFQPRGYSPAFAPREERPGSPRSAIENCMEDYCDQNATLMGLQCNGSTRLPQMVDAVAFSRACRLCGHTDSQARNDSAIEVHCIDVLNRETRLLWILAGLVLVSALLTSVCMYCRNRRDRGRAAFALERSMKQNRRPNADWKSVRGVIYDGTGDSRSSEAEKSKRSWLNTVRAGQSMSQKPVMAADLERAQGGEDKLSPNYPDSPLQSPWYIMRPLGQCHSKTRSGSDNARVVSKPSGNSITVTKTGSRRESRVPILPHARSSSINLPVEPGNSLKLRQPLRDFSGNSFEADMPTTHRIYHEGLMGGRLTHWDEESETSISVARRGGLPGENQSGQRV